MSFPYDVRRHHEAVTYLLDEVIAVPNEHHGVSGRYIVGSTWQQQARNIREAAKRRGIRVTIATDSDELGNVDFYVRMVGRKNV